MAAVVDYRETLVVYLRSETINDAAKTLCVTRAALVARINVLKKAGVNVPPMKRRHGSISSLDVAQLNSLIKKYKKETQLGGH